MTPLQRSVLAALTGEWQSTYEVKAAITTRTYAPLIHDVAAALRALRREGKVERESRGTDGHAWRLAEVAHG